MGRMKLRKRIGVITVIVLISAGSVFFLSSSNDDFKPSSRPVFGQLAYGMQIESRECFHWAPPKSIVVVYINWYYSRCCYR